jgi:hypothetical protein
MGITVSVMLAFAGRGRLEIVDESRQLQWLTVEDGLVDTSVGERPPISARMLIRVPCSTAAVLPPTPTLPVWSTSHATIAVSAGSS